MMDTRRPPALGPPPSYAFVRRVYRASLRPVVASTTAIGAIWALASAIGYFRNYSVDRTQNVPKLVLYSIALGAIYMGVFAIELYGFLSSLANRSSLVKIYAYLSILSALAVAAAGLLDIIVHFMLKQQIIGICSELTNGDELVYYGFFGPVYHTVITPSEALQYCTDSWNHDSWSVVVAFLFTTFLAIVFSAIAFGYLHQLVDPTSPINSSRAPSNQVRSDEYPPHYNPAYSTTYNGPYGGQAYYGAPNTTTGTGRYPPPPGSPPDERDDPFVPPEDGKPPRYSGGPLGYDVSDDKEDPFNLSVPERDVTSRPTPGGRERF